MEKARGVFVFSRIFIWELMGVTSGHGNPINRSRDRKTLPEEEVELDWAQKKQEKVVGKAGGLAKKKKLEFQRKAGIERGPGFLNPKSGRNRWRPTTAKNNFLFRMDFVPQIPSFPKDCKTPVCHSK